VFCYQQFSNDQFSLFGFTSRKERDFFKLLIQVPGIGPKLAIRSLSQVHYRDFQRWIWDADEGKISGITGIGKKTASKIILEIKDKLTAPSAGSGEKTENIVFQEGALALESLGFEKGKVKKALAELEKRGTENLTLEWVIKQALALLNKK
jgi:Holliday junction DNA helicase RuvA